MKIGLITDTYYAVNGVSRTYQQFAAYCQLRDIELDIFTIGKQHQTSHQGSVTIQQLAASWPVKYYFDLPPFDAKIVSPGFSTALAKKPYDIFHLATPGSLGIAARILLTNSPVPKIGVFHTMLAEYAGMWTTYGLQKLPAYVTQPMAGFSEKLTWHMLKWFYSQCAVVLAPSTVIKKQLKILQRPLALFPRGIDTELFTPVKRHSKTKKPIALYVGRLSTEKNLDLLVALFRKRHNCELWIVGDGPYAHGLKNQLPNATFFGYQHGERLAQLYASADIFIFPSTTDTFGNAVLEAQASGLPVIVTNSGGPQELVSHNKNGLIVSPTINTFSHALDKLIKNSELRKKFGMHGREVAQKRSWPHAFDQLLSIYTEVCNKSNS